MTWASVVVAREEEIAIVREIIETVRDMEESGRHQETSPPTREVIVEIVPTREAGVIIAASIEETIDAKPAEHEMTADESATVKMKAAWTKVARSDADIKMETSLADLRKLTRITKNSVRWMMGTFSINLSSFFIASKLCIMDAFARRFFCFPFFAKGGIIF